MALAIKHHVVPQWALRPFTDDGERLWPFNVRTGELVLKNRPGTKTTGYIENFNSILQIDGSLDDGIETFLAKEIDAPGARLALQARQAGRVSAEARASFALIVAAQMMRTPRGLRSVRETAPQGEQLDRDAVLRRLNEILGLAGEDARWERFEGANWRIVTPPPNRHFALSDCPVTSRLDTWPAGNSTESRVKDPLGGPPIPPPQITRPLAPDACLLINFSPPGWGPTKQLSERTFNEIEARTLQAADCWIWAQQERTIRAVRERFQSGELAPLDPVQLGQWPTLGRSHSARRTLT